MARSSSGLGRVVFSHQIAGSNPARATNNIPLAVHGSEEFRLLNQAKLHKALPDRENYNLFYCEKRY